MGPEMTRREVFLSLIGVGVAASLPLPIGVAEIVRPREAFFYGDIVSIDPASRNPIWAAIVTGTDASGKFVTETIRVVDGQPDPIASEKIWRHVTKITLPAS